MTEKKYGHADYTELEIQQLNFIIRLSAIVIN